MNNIQKFEVECIDYFKNRGYVIPNNHYSFVNSYSVEDDCHIQRLFFFGIGNNGNYNPINKRIRYRDWIRNPQLYDKYLMEHIIPIAKKYCVTKITLTKFAIPLNIFKYNSETDKWISQPN